MSEFSLDKEFKKSALEVFSSNLVFAFICGSYASSSAVKGNSDIDMFLCLKKRDLKEEIKFKNWYLKVHGLLGYRFDDTFFCEFVELDYLKKSLDIFKENLPSKTTVSKKEYDNLVWAGMLSGKSMSFVGNKEEYINLKGVS